MENQNLDNKKIISDYWNHRWKVTGERGGVSEFQKIDEKYLERNKRDYERLNEALKSVNMVEFKDGAEAGAGAGRLTPFYNQFTKNLTCFDISKEACEHFKNQGLTNRYVVMPLSDLGKRYKENFDIAISFTVVQHIHGKDEFVNTLKSIQASLKIGGIYLLHEDISAWKQIKTPAIHMNEFSPQDYAGVLDYCGLIYSKEYHYTETNEDDLVAIFQRIR